MKRLLPIVVAVAALFVGFWTVRHSDEANAALQSKDLGSVLEPMLAEQSAAWNRGDIPTFMKAYWNDPKLTFSSGGKTERGWQATLDRYKKNAVRRECCVDVRALEAGEGRANCWKFLIGLEDDRKWLEDCSRP